MFRCARFAEFDIIDGGEACEQDIARREMDHAMQNNGWHDMDKERGDLVEGVENHAIAPHGDGNGVIAVGEAVGADEKPLGPWECPDGEHGEQVDKIAKVEKKVMVALPVVSEVTNGHEVGELQREPVVEAGGPGTNEIATDEDVEDGGDEG